MKRTTHKSGRVVAELDEHDLPKDQFARFKEQMTTAQPLYDEQPVYHCVVMSDGQPAIYLPGSDVHVPSNALRVSEAIKAKLTEDGDGPHQCSYRGLPDGRLAIFLHDFDLHLTWIDADFRPYQKPKKRRRDREATALTKLEFE